MKDKLIEILNETFAEQYEKRGLLTAPHTADHLLANGVIVPPCKVGDTVFIIDEADDECSEDYVLDVKVLQFFINKHGIAVDLELPLGLRLNTWAVIGKNVFLTKEEAEKALAERSGE